MAVYNHQLKANVVVVNIFFDAHTTELYCPPDNACDMGGAIKMALAVDPDVEKIKAWNGQECVVYFRHGLDEWRSYVETKNAKPA